MSHKQYGRNRESIADIELELHNIFIEHPDATIAEDGNPVIPADALVDVFQSFSDLHGGMELLAPDEITMLKELIASNPGIQVTPQVAIAFVAEKTKHSPPQSDEEQPRGREEERGEYQSNSRSSSSDSVGTHRNYSRPPSRGPPQTPRSAASPFDTSRRQRSTPLGGAAAPSSWAKRPPHHRRKSDAGSKSDTEQFSASPSAFGRGPAGRTRAPSNPTSPSTSTTNPEFSPPPNTRSRPPSRQQGRSDPIPTDPDEFDYTLRQGLSSLPMPRTGDSDSDSDDDGGNMVMDRSAASSTVSMMPHERVEALQRVNDDLARKLQDTERMMQRKLAEQEAEFDDLQVKLEETRNELSAAKREEKELRSKERQNNTQIGALEAEVAKVTKQLETSKASYNSLQRQYLDQCARAEKYRDDLRDREETVRSMREAAGLTQIEIARYAKEHEVYEQQIAHLEQELVVAQQAHVQLEEQKQENMLLKETIDRMRFDLDEMRNSSAAGVGAGGSRVVGEDEGGWGGLEDDGEEEAEEEDGSGSSAATPGADDDDTEGEDVIQTIITRKKRKVPSRAAVKVEHRAFEETKEYSDVATQYEPHLFFFSTRTQTDPEPKILTASATIQTDPEPVVEPPPPPQTAEMEIQTEPEPEPEPTPDDSKVAGPSTSTPTDAPPAYKQVLSPEEQEAHDWRVTVATLKKYHPGARIEEGVPGGVSLDALEDWRALKEELGVNCLVVEKILEASPRTGLRARRRTSPAMTPHPRCAGGGIGSTTSTTPIPQQVLWVGGTVLFFLMLGPSVMIPYYSMRARGFAGGGGGVGGFANDGTGGGVELPGAGRGRRSADGEGVADLGASIAPTHPRSL
ncbi:hypothetical protein MSAN_00316100 [Mycena sanguinolenta]|uniref:Uncharacterized protein n=1 Tax=Mycena sanguinolenta TaxID=230812 RepID=A0A8H6ZCF6_9AGAR|nr:hypothetical protein MSAN_00316100 [Mycena sanguinolenta]